MYKNPRVALFSSAFKVELIVHTKQQYYVHYCHKICGDCLQKSLRCPICEKTSDFNFSKHTKYIFDTSITKNIEICSLHDFHDIFQGLESFLQFFFNKNKKTRLFHTNVHWFKKGFFNNLFSSNST